MRNLTILCMLFLSNCAVASAKTLYFNRPADTAQARYVIELLSLAYKDIGHKLEIIDFDRHSALIAANEGELDGQLGRIAGVTDSYANLIYVDYPLYSFNLQLISHCLVCTFNQLDSLVVQSGYLVAYQYMMDNQYTGELIEVKSTAAQLNLLMQKKVQGALIVDFHLREHLPYMDMEAVKIEDLMTIESFHYLHKKHSALIPRLKQTLKKLEKKGVTAVLKAKYLI
ncbi:transporter substrate-binding domain-containing protein [Pseudoalteromonas luteoviolacea]|nr:transporter substrate-binding domain-containing protein [Pseudoalteromonas luteoviolacea]